MTAAETLTRRDTGLVWGLKDSFLAYVEGRPDGSVELSPGTGQLPDGSFYFSPDPAAPPTALQFRGGVRLRAHGGMLDVCLADPRVDEASGQSVLSAETWKDGVWQRIPFADVSWAPTVAGTDGGGGDGDAGAGAAEPGDAGDGTLGAGTAEGVMGGDSAVRTLLAETRLHPEATALFDDTYPAGEFLSPLLIRTALDVPDS